MIYETLDTIKKLLEQELAIQSQNWMQGDKVTLSNIYDADGRCSLETNTVSISLINLEETYDEQYHNLQRQNTSGYTEQLRAPLTLTLSLLFTANFDNYDQSLKILAYVMRYFQGMPVINRQNAPNMPDCIEKLHLKLFSQNLEQAKDIWSFLGGRYLPSVMYSVKGTEIAVDHAIERTLPTEGVPQPNSERINKE